MVVSQQGGAEKRRTEEPAAWPPLTWTKVRAAFLTVLPWWVGSRLLCLAGLMAARAGWGTPGMVGPDTYFVWDDGWYLHIAEHGYGYAEDDHKSGAPAFMPMLPFIMRWGGLLVGGHPAVAGAIAANVGALGGAAAL